MGQKFAAQHPGSAAGRMHQAQPVSARRFVLAQGGYKTVCICRRDGRPKRKGLVRTS